MSGVIKLNIYLITVIMVEIIHLWLTAFVSAKLSYSIFIILFDFNIGSFQNRPEYTIRWSPVCHVPDEEPAFDKSYPSHLSRYVPCTLFGWQGKILRAKL